MTHLSLGNHMKVPDAMTTIFMPKNYHISEVSLLLKFLSWFNPREWCINKVLAAVAPIRTDPWPLKDIWVHHDSSNNIEHRPSFSLKMQEKIPVLVCNCVNRIGRKKEIYFLFLASLVLPFNSISRMTYKLPKEIFCH